MLRSFVIAALAALVAAAPALASPAPRPEKRCGDVGSLATPDAPQDVRALGASCRTAKRLARRHWRSTGDGERCDLDGRSCKIGDWTCRRTFFGNAGTRVRCSRGDDRVRFFYGV